MSTPSKISIWDARVNLTELVLRVRYKNERFIIEKHGKPFALVTPIDSAVTEMTVEVAPFPTAAMKLKVFETGR